jgi:hypothetical protein
MAVRSLILGTGILFCITAGAIGQPLSENFSAGIPANWPRLNESAPIGSQTSGWFAPPTEAQAFPAYNGPRWAFAEANWLAAAGNGTCDAWMMTPPVYLSNGAYFSFWTRSPTNSTYPDRMQMRYSTAGNSTLTADFKSNPTLLEINPTQAQNGYPQVWKSFGVILSDLPGTVLGRIAFRYYVTDCGPLGLSGDVVGVDAVSYTPEPSAIVPLMIIAAFAARRRSCRVFAGRSNGT